MDDMKKLLKNAVVYTDGGFKNTDVLLSNGIIAAIGDNLPIDGSFVFDFSNRYIFPGFVDVHVHFREPGFSYKETIGSGSRAAAKGGYTTVMTMPNLSPVPDSVPNLELQLAEIKRQAVINVIPYGSITVGAKGQELSDMEGMSGSVIGFSDDGKGVQDRAMMRAAMQKAASLKKPIAAHCEDESLLFGGVIHDGEYAKQNGFPGICSRSEWGPIERDVEIVRETGCAYHVCHVSARESVDVIRRAKRKGADITCETAPHYLIFDDTMLLDEGRFKMNPPIRAKADREALIEGILDGTVDMIATDHAPHSAEEKSRGLKGSNMGVVGLETAFPALYTHLVKTGIISLEKLVCLMSTAPAGRFGIKSGIRVGAPADLCVYDLDTEYVVDPKEFVSKGKSTPFESMKLNGSCVMTFVGGEIVWQK